MPEDPRTWLDRIADKNEETFRTKFDRWLDRGQDEYEEEVEDDGSADDG